MNQPIESLESRMLLTAELSAAGVLTVTGTAEADQIKIFVSRDGTELVVKEVGKANGLGGNKAARPLSRGPGRAGDRGKPRGGGQGTGNGESNDTETAFDLAEVKSIVVNGAAGNDHVTLHGRRKSLLNIPATINGGAGNDHLRGGLANDVINGEAGNDNIDGFAGNDTLGGGDGRDFVTGGLGADSISGGNGNDHLNALDGAGTDTVDGGAHDAPPAGKRKPAGDQALIDTGDTASNVERLRARAKRPGGGGSGGGSRK